MTTPNKKDQVELTSFIDSTGSNNHLRVEQDFGGGYVRLKSSEAERRQAVQDIRSTEDILLELLRNARDAQAKNIFIAVSREKSHRKIVVIDDGLGIPATMQDRVFEPRVTSKLDTSHIDKWGIHGRGMALYSISVNAMQAFVQLSKEGLGTSIVVETDLDQLPEKADQSTFPRFEKNDDVYVMRGPKNILRTAAEFSLEHQKDCRVYCGSFTEIAATMYEYSLESTTPSQRGLPSLSENLPLIKQLGCAGDPNDFAQRSIQLGIVISSRSARRIIDGSIKSLPSITERLEYEAFPHKNRICPDKVNQKGFQHKNSRVLKLSTDDIYELKHEVDNAIDDLAKRYYFEHDSCDIRVEKQRIQISIPIQPQS